VIHDVTVPHVLTADVMSQAARSIPANDTASDAGVRLRTSTAA
jgi:hypothetical protein